MLLNLISVECVDNSYYVLEGKTGIQISDMIPDSWQWCRLSQLFHIVMGVSPKSESISSNPDGMEFHQGKINFTAKIVDNSRLYTNNPLKIAPANSVLLCVRAPVGEVNITDRDICIGRGLAAVIPLCKVDVLFAFYWLKALKESFLAKAAGTTFLSITSKTVKEQIIPVPPLDEQKRIVEMIEKSYEYLNSILTSL